MTEDCEEPDCFGQHVGNVQCEQCPFEDDCNIVALDEQEWRYMETFGED